ncbi:hypothetical protein RND81_14G047400 [Saponaria officinalis]|uniref:Uncharacterized protein n=1 Tax=Saponaria officinalis TaxID=3572 RepID=A0AAW1GNI7_SAPOF
MEVKIVRREIVKPSSPTPSHLKTMSLPFVDQLSPFTFHLPSLLVYPKTEKSSALDLNALKSSLSETLTEFYPFAGRCIDDSTLSCNDEGVTFVVADVIDSTLESVLESPRKIDLLAELLPPKDCVAYGGAPRHISENIPVVLQVNVFPCGGVVIGCYLFHKLMDASTIGTFFRCWTAFASKNFEGFVRPNFEATLATFPPVDLTFVESVAASRGKQMMQLRPPAPVTLLAKTFVFSNMALSKLRAKAVSEAVPRPSRFEALAGFIAKHALAAAKESLGKDALASPTLLRMTVNMRPRLTPPLPQESVGNVITNALARLEKQDGLPGFVEDIHAAFSAANEKITRFQSEKGADAFVTDKEGPETSPWMKPGEYFITSWCRLGLSETDLGFGKPKWAIPIGQIFSAHRNRICFIDHSGPNGDGIEAWLILAEKEMEILESNSDFLEYATPS